jgi:arginine repressor
MNIEQRRRHVVDILRSEVITSVNDLIAALKTRTGESIGQTTAKGDLEAIGVVRVQVANGVWRYRTADILNSDDVRLALQDRLASDGVDVLPCSDGVVIRTTKGTGASVSTLVKMLIDYQLDNNIRWVIGDEDHVMIGIEPAAVRSDYLSTFRTWSGLGGKR